ncbi:PAS domain-containing sensor histidine kinase [Agriterribacter sp.]|uniref:sensor histidine kinase n=1 Tax=Agriterribacter sp. TaxID=2821509 RepID=UPI002C657825|nr:PAS domain-containing sensor histidine kinase [Agriterribacter sp.]HRO47548.1 PAS domain-containing sensor histidine kinase [Agriterribacter sp.]HRQ16993.1 PAS domain-containing sensor histidine kinase [Agriterribacter sp.]
MSYDLLNNTKNLSHFEAFFEYATMGILVTDCHGRIITINPFALKEFGYSEEELVGKTIEVLIPQRFYNHHIHHREKYAENPQTRPMGLGMDLFGIRKDGAEFPVEVSLGHYTSNGGKYIVAFITNISIRKAAEAEIEKLNIELGTMVRHRTRDLREAIQQLEKSKDRLENVLFFQKTLLDTAGAIIIATDENGIIKLFNPEAACKLGYSESEVIDKKTPVLFHTKKDIERKRKELLNVFGIKVNNSFDVLIEKARRNIHDEEEFNYIAKTGASFPVSLTITALRSIKGNITGYVGIAIDISERIKAEKELKKVQRLFLQLLHNYPDGLISIIDKNYNFVYTGGELHKRLHSDIAELIGKEMYPRFPEPLRKIIFVKLENVFQNKALISDFELPYPIVNHTYIMDAFPLIEEDGSINNIGVIIKNISRLKKAEGDLREALKIEKHLGELKSRFVSMASHEFRTPLSTVLSSAYLIEKYTSGEDQPKREKHLQRIVSSVNMLTDILNDFLSLSKIEEGKLQANFSEFNIEEMMHATLEEIKNNLKNKQQINYRHKGNPGVFLDKSLLKHILLNLVSNASKFSSDTSAIDIKTSNQNEKIILSVKDNGIGISKEDQQHLTKRFFRGSNAENIQGTGLGLHIISKYAEMMNGNIECRSQLEKGTEFIVTFNAKKYHHEKSTFNRRQ